MKTKTENFLETYHKLDFTGIKDQPNILIAASFWDADRYQTALTCYNLMRKIDDYVDDYKASHSDISEKDQERMVAHVQEWISRLKENAKNSNLNGMTEVFGKYLVPVWPFEIFARSMIYDIQHDGFESVQTFLEYSQGASVAPASIFVHLCGLRRINGHYLKPLFDVREAATPCAIFSYLVHIIRDFQIDQESHLNYFADNLLGKYGLNRQDLREMAGGGNIKPGFRKLVNEYKQLMDLFRQQTFATIEKISPYLETKYLLSLHLIFNLYQMVYERIDPKMSRFSSKEMNPSEDEIRERVYQTILEFVE